MRQPPDTARIPHRVHPGGPRLLHYRIFLNCILKPGHNAINVLTEN